MKPLARLLLICVLGLGCATVRHPGTRDRAPALEALVAQVGAVDGWVPDGEAEHATGEDLFLLINGGAEVYLEHGFSEALFQAYRSPAGKWINLELYGMATSEGAAEVHAFKTGEEGSPIDIGDEGRLASYYLNCRRGKVLITVIGLDTDPQTLAGIEAIARAVDAALIHAF